MRRHASDPSNHPKPAKLARISDEASAPWPTASPFLPADIFRLIFAFLPSSFLVRSPSLVCKRWRHLVLSLTTSLTLRYDDLPERLDEDSPATTLGLLSSLTRLHLHLDRPRFAAVRLPASLTALHLRGKWGNQEPSCIDYCPRLTELSFRCKGDPTSLVDVLINSRRTLKTLELGVTANMTSDGGVHLQFCCADPFPALTTLKLRLSDDFMDFSLVRMLSSLVCLNGRQLTSLSVCYGRLLPGGITRWLPAHSYPLLTSLSLNSESGIDLCTSALLAKLSHINTLELTHPMLHNLQPQAFATASSSLTSITYQHNSLLPSHLEAWKRLPHLRTVYKVGWDPTTMRALKLSGYCHMLQSLALTADSDLLAAVMCGCTNLTALCWEQSNAASLQMFGGLPDRSLPHLRKLRFDQADRCTLPMLASALSRLRPACPDIQRCVWNASLSDFSMANLWKLRDACPSLLYFRAAVPYSDRVERSHLKRLPFQVEQAESPTVEERRRLARSEDE